VWYLRAETPELREKWLDIIKEQHSDSKLTRTGSLRSTFSTASISRISTTSYKRGTGLKAKLAEMETFKDILARQIETLQVYFDACANSVSKRFEPYNAERANNDEIDDTEYNHNSQRNFNDHTLNEIHGAMGVDFKGEAFTFKSTTSGVLYNLAHCIELMQQREEFWEKKIAHEIDKRKRLEEQMKEMNAGKKITPILTGPDFEEGPHSNIKEDQFFDAIDSTLDTLEQEEERRVQAYESRANIPVLKQVKKHRLSEEIERIVQDHIKFDIIDDFNSNVWELLASDGEMKVYRRELEENGIVIDPLKAVHTVRGITGFELCKYFWDPVVRMEWEGTLETSR
jgi:collagen type IV alpha-3-binding protein